MKVEVKLYASLGRHAPSGASGEPFFLEPPEGTTVRDLLNLLDVPENSVKIIFLNGVHANLDTVLNEGDRLGGFPPGAGG